jgi:hypothetical protein
MFYFWYNYFLIISAISTGIKRSANSEGISQEVIYKIIKDLIDISEFSIIVLGDLYKRNYEALGNILLAFYSDNLMNLVKKKKETITSEKVRSFLERTIEIVEENRCNKIDTQS